MTIAPAVGAGAVRVGRPSDRGSARRRAWSALAIAWLLVVATAPPTVAAPSSLSLTATYRVNAHIHWSRGSMLVSSTALVTNSTPSNVTRLVFNLVPLVTGKAELLAVSVARKTVDAVARGQTVVVRLPQPLAPGHRVLVKIRYRAQFNAVTGWRQPLFGQVDGVITAYRWIPWLSRRQPFHAPNFGETWVTGVSPSVTVTLTSAAPLIFATSGTRTGRTTNSQTFSAQNVRDFNFSASPDYKVRRLTSNGVAVRIYYLTGRPDLLAQSAIAALDRFSDKVAPYPHKSLNLAEVPISTGMESPALVWISDSATPEAVRRIVIHEVAHQWFYSAVGNNQGLQPFLDESVSEFLMRNLLDSFPRSACATERLDLSVYDYGASCYADIVYIQGARYLERYRSEVGSHDFWVGLRAFYEANKLDLGNTRALLDSLDAASGYDSQRHANRFPGLYP